jgi:hypothetical protein
VDIEAIQNIKKNENVSTFFGKYSNYHYLLYYGFVDIHNSIPIEVFLDLKIKNGSPKNNYEEVLLSPNMKINSTLRSFRKIVAKFNMGKLKNKNFESPFDIHIEVESLRLLKVGLKTQLSRYSSDIQQDIEKFQNSSDKNIKNLLTVLIEEKRIIVKYYNAAVIFYKMLDKSKDNHQANQPMYLTKKISYMILRKKYIRNYFNLIKKIFKLNIELFTEGADDNQQDLIDIGEEDLQNDSEYEDHPELNYLNSYHSKDNQNLDNENYPPNHMEFKNPNQPQDSIENKLPNINQNQNFVDNSIQNHLVHAESSNDDD